MKKSLFKKFFFTFLSVMLVGFILFSVVVLGFSGNYWMKQNKTMLANQAKTVVGQLENGALLYRGEWLYQYVHQVTAVMCQATECQILVANGNGIPEVIVGDSIALKPLPPTVMAIQGVHTGNLDGVLMEDCLVVSQPFMAGKTVGRVFALIPLSEMENFLWGLIQLLLIAILIIAILLFISAYVTASALVRPLTQMATAARCLAKGDFSKRIQSKRTDEVGRLAHAFNDMTLSLEAGEKMRRGFVADVSHELKTPMTTIAGFVDGILDGTVPKERQNEYLTIVSGEIKRLSRLVNTLLNLSRLESGETAGHLATMDLTPKIFSVAFMFEKAITDKQLQLEGLDELPSLWVNGDGDMLHQVIYNLLDNAVKYTPEQGCITLHGRQDKNCIYFTIRNTGSGIHEDHLPFIFDRFYKVDQSRGQDKNSLGLGLYLTKTIVTQHGGTITVRSVENAYCEFEVVLPICQ